MTIEPRVFPILINIPDLIEEVAGLFQSSFDLRFKKRINFVFVYDMFWAAQHFLDEHVLADGFLNESSWHLDWVVIAISGVTELVEIQAHFLEIFFIFEIKYIIFAKIRRQN